MDKSQHPGSAFFVVSPLQHGAAHGLIALQRDVGDEAQAALVDADQGHPMGGQSPANAQLGAVPPNKTCESREVRCLPLMGLVEGLRLFAPILTKLVERSSGKSQAACALLMKRACVWNG